MTDAAVDHAVEALEELAEDRLADEEAAAIAADAADETPPPPRPTTPMEVVARWRTEGPLIHEPTGLETLDAATGGGPVYGSRWFVAGAPDAGKTALELAIADTYARRGLAVGLLAVDEEDGDLVTRLSQRAGIPRWRCERRAPEDLADVEAAVSGLGIAIYDGGWTIEGAAGDLAERAASRGVGAMLGIDSVQTVRCDAEMMAERTPSTSEAVTMRVTAIRDVATRHRLIAIATSEMARGAYRSRRTAENIDPMAAAKWSGAVEYQARVLLALRSVPGESDLIELTLPKNKQRPADDRTEAIYLRIDRARQTLAEELEYRPEDEEGDRTAQRDAQTTERVTSDAATLAHVLASTPGLTTRELRAAVRAAGGVGKDRADAACSRLGAGLVRVDGRGSDGRGRAVRHYLLGAEVPADVLERVPLSERPTVLAARPPTEQT